MAKAEKLKDISMATDALLLNYDFSERLALQIESSISDIGVLVTGGFSALAEVASIIPGVEETELYQDITNVYRASINYNESVKNKIQTSLPESLTLRTAKGNRWNHLYDMLANNAPSIGVGILGGGAGAFFTRNIVGRAAKIQARKKIAKSLSTVFFSMESGRFLADTEIAKMHAPKQIATLKSLYDQAETESEKYEIIKEIGNLEKTLSMSQFKKVFLLWLMAV